LTLLTFWAAVFLTFNIANKSLCRTLYRTGFVTPLCRMGFVTPSGTSLCRTGFVTPSETFVSLLPCGLLCRTGLQPRQHGSAGKYQTLRTGLQTPSGIRNPVRHPQPRQHGSAGKCAVQPVSETTKTVRSKNRKY